MKEILLNPQSKFQVDTFLAKPAHALGLAGSEGTGKVYLAKHIISKILNIAPDKLEHYPYFRIFDDSAVGIDEVREIQSFLRLKVPGEESIKRFVLISNIDDTSREAQNALLKILEEPPEDTLIICTTSKKSGVPSTIVSRLQWINVKPVSLSQVIKSKIFDASPADLEKNYYISDGNMGLLCALMEDSDSQHELVEAIDNAKKILRSTKYENLCGVESITKNKNSNPELLVDGIYRVLHAAMRASLKDNKISKAQLKNLKTKIENTLEAKKMLQNRVQPKLALSWLMYNL